RVDLLGRPVRRDDAVEAQRQRQTVGGPDSERAAAVPIVADLAIHPDIGTATPVEVVNAQAEDPEPAAAPEANIQIEQLVIPLAQNQVVAGLVAGAVGSARLEKQRPELITADHVEQPNRRVAANLADRSVVSEGLGVVVTPLIRNRRIQAEGTDTPPRIQIE